MFHHPVLIFFLSSSENRTPGFYVSTVLPQANVLLTRVIFVIPPIVMTVSALI